jgi:hypothetical protein
MMATILIFFENNEVSNDDVNQSDESLDELVSVLRSNEMSKEDLAAVHLAAFYDSKMTQSGLTTFLQLSNISSNIKLPTTFDGLVRILTEDKPKPVDSKSWFCGVCLKNVTNLKNRFQRECETCKAKLHMYYYLNIADQINNIINKFSGNDFKYESDPNTIKATIK